MSARKLTFEAEELLAQEARRRAERAPRIERRRTKELAADAGVTYGYAANVIAKKRREIEANIKVDIQMSNVNSQPSETD